MDVMDAISLAEEVQVKCRSGDSPNFLIVNGILPFSRKKCIAEDDFSRRFEINAKKDGPGRSSDAILPFLARGGLPHAFRSECLDPIRSPDPAVPIAVRIVRALLLADGDQLILQRLGIEDRSRSAAMAGF